MVETYKTWAIIMDPKDGFLTHGWLGSKKESQIPLFFATKQEAIAHVKSLGLPQSTVRKVSVEVNG